MAGLGALPWLSNRGESVMSMPHECRCGICGGEMGWLGDVGAGFLSKESELRIALMKMDLYKDAIREIWRAPRLSDAQVICQRVLTLEERS
jgi:hypothetical protein